MKKLYIIALLVIGFSTMFGLDRTIEQEIENRESWLELLEETATIYRDVLEQNDDADIRKRLQKTENRISREKAEISELKKRR